MSEPSPHHPSIPLTFSAGGSPVRICPSQASRPVWRVIDPACFTRWRGSFARYAPGSGSWRTSQISLISGFQLYSQKWPRAGMMRAGECSELTIHWSAHHTVERGGSVSAGWPTPSAQIFDQSPEIFDARRARLKAKGINGNGAGRLLAVEVRRSWPTPSATDHKGSSKPGQRRGQLTEPLEPGSGGRLNPRWVEALQGFPPGWTALTDGRPLRDHSTHGSHPEPELDNPTTGSD